MDVIARSPEGMTKQFRRVPYVIMGLLRRPFGTPRNDSIRNSLFLVSSLLFVLTSGCQYNISGNPDVNLLAVHVSPDSAVVPTNGSLALTATIKDFLHDGTVTWSIEEPNGGTIVSNGLTATYTAPAGLNPALSVVHIRVSADEDPTRYVICPVAIKLPPDTDTLFTISPSAVWMLTNAPQQFTIDTVSAYATPVPPLRWTVVSGPGTISNVGLYTPPTSTADNTIAIIQATSISDSTLYSQATITLHNYADSLKCFSRDVLPILSSSCGMSGCHDATSHKSNYNALTYQSTRRVVTPGNARASRLYSLIIEFNANLRMPPPPQSALTPMQVMTVGQWIDQGAVDCQ